MNKTTRIIEYFADVETTKEHNGCFCSVGEAPAAVIPGSLSGLRNFSQTSQRAANKRVKGFLAGRFCIERIPCYYWLLCLPALIEVKPLNQCLMGWAQPLLPAGMKAMAVSFDGKTVRPAVRELIGMVEAEGCIIVADALHCRKGTAALTGGKKAGYLLSVKGNQPALKKGAGSYVQDGNLRESMNTFTACGKNGGRIEMRAGFVTHDIDWLYGKGGWV
jgi:hypothetical protein